MVGDITNVLNFELKNVQLKDQQYQELLQQYDELKVLTADQLREGQEQRQQELMGLQQNFEKKYLRFKEYQMDIEKINLELQAQVDQLRQENV